MTLNQLLSETYALGFEEAEELTQSFVFSANRAIRLINSELGDEKTGCIFISKDKSDRPIPEMPEYEITSFIPEFLYATRAPFDKTFTPISGASVIGSSLFVPKNYSGELFLRYKPYFESLTLDDSDTDIKIPRRCEHLCPILTAAFIWLDDDEEKATYYMQIYKEEAARMKFEVRKSMENAYVDVTGWAG